MIFFGDDQVEVDAHAEDHPRAQDPHRRHLQQDQGQGRRLIETVSLPAVSARFGGRSTEAAAILGAEVDPRGNRRSSGYLAFFVVPIAFIVMYSFGAKDSTQRIPVNLGSPGFHNYSEAFSSTFFTTFKATIKIAFARNGADRDHRLPGGRTSSPSRCARRSGGRSLLALVIRAELHQLP